ncbi:SulP family inorganic anion transporter [soil metagenome]
MEDKVSFRPIDNLAHDVPAALVVFLVALPLCLGIALASGAPLFSGLVAGVVGGIVAGFLSKSPVSVSGPAAGLTTIVLASLAELGSFPLFLSALIIAGAMQIAFGFAKAGTLGHFFPVSVIKGMLAAIGLILILKQIPHAFGYDADFEGDEQFSQADGQNTFTEIVSSIENLHVGAVIICLISLAVLIFWDRPAMKKFRGIKYFPAPLVVVVLGIILNYVFELYAPSLAVQEGQRVNLDGFNKISDLGASLNFPDLSGFTDPRVYRIALTLAVIASLETLLSIEAADKLDPFKRVSPLNHELKSQGLANMASGFLGGLPITAVIVRSSANVHAGARTKASAIIHGFLLASVVLLIPGVLKMIPLACLAGILLVVGFKLTSPEVFKEVWKKGKDQFLPFIITIVAIIFTDLLIGIFVGILVSVFFVLKTNFKSAIILVNNEQQYLLKFTKDVSFLHKSSLRNALDKIPNNSAILIDGSKSQFLDTDIIETIEDFMKSSRSRLIKVEIKKTNDALNPLFKKEPESAKKMVKLDNLLIINDENVRDPFVTK